MPPPMPDATELTLFGIVGAVMLVLLASWPIQWWLQRRLRAAAPGPAGDDERLDALAESPALMEAVRSRSSTLDPRSCTEVWRDEEGCYRPGPHGCALIGGHRIHRCVCGALVTEDPPLPVEPDPIAIAPPARPFMLAKGMVKLGRNTLCRACVDHRTNGRYADICDSCRPSLIGSARGLS